MCSALATAWLPPLGKCPALFKERREQADSQLSSRSGLPLTASSHRWLRAHVLVWELLSGSSGAVLEGLGGFLSAPPTAVLAQNALANA